MIVWLLARAFLDARSFANQSLVCMTCPLPGASFNSVDLLMLDASGDIERVGAVGPVGFELSVHAAARAAIARASGASANGLRVRGAGWDIECSSEVAVPEGRLKEAGSGCTHESKNDVRILPGF